MESFRSKMSQLCSAAEATDCTAPNSYRRGLNGHTIGSYFKACYGVHVVFTFFMSNLCLLLQ